MSAILHKTFGCKNKFKYILKMQDYGEDKMLKKKKKTEKNILQNSFQTFYCNAHQG
jgi:hypothetical protein